MIFLKPFLATFLVLSGIFIFMLSIVGVGNFVRDILPKWIDDHMPERLSEYADNIIFASQVFCTIFAMSAGSGIIATVVQFLANRIGL